MSNRPVNLDERFGRPITLAGALGGLLQKLGARASDADLAKRWAQIMGADIANIATLAAIKKTPDGRYNVTIRPTNPAFTLQLSYMKDEITTKINKYFGRDAVAKISFRK